MHVHYTHVYTMRMCTRLYVVGWDLYFQHKNTRIRRTQTTILRGDCARIQARCAGTEDARAWIYVPGEVNLPVARYRFLSRSSQSIVYRFRSQLFSLSSDRPLPLGSPHSSPHLSLYEYPLLYHPNSPSSYILFYILQRYSTHFRSLYHFLSTLSRYLYNYPTLSNPLSLLSLYIYIILVSLPIILLPTFS